MPTDLPLAAVLPPGVSFKKSHHLFAGTTEISFDVTAKPGSAVLAALIANEEFPPGKVDLESLSLSVSGERPVPLGGSKGPVTFSGKASAFQGLTVLATPAEVIACLVRDQINDDLAGGLALDGSGGNRFLLLRWGYDLQGSARGSVGLGAGGKVTFGAEGKRLGAYAIIHELAPGAPSRDAVKDLLERWMVPAQFGQVDDLRPGSSIVAEVDGSIALKLGAQYGFDFSWVREAVTLGGLSGDIGLKVQLGVSASFGFEASGQYSIALSRPRAGRQLRLQLFRLNRKGLNLAFSAAASAQGRFGGLLPNFHEFVESLLGIHALQVLKDLEKWTGPDQKLSDLLAEVSPGYAQELLTKVTGVDARTQFEAARTRLVQLLFVWQALPHKVAATVLSSVKHEPAQILELRTHLKRVATDDLTAFQPDLQKLLSRVEFFKTPFGAWLESAASTSVLAAASDRAEYGRVQDVARKTLAVLDGSVLESTLVRLQGEVGQRMGLDKIEQIVNEATFDDADEWLKARLSAFLGKAVDVAQVQQVRTTIHNLLKLQERFYDQARSALTRKYEVSMLATYQKATTQTALLDVVFDYDGAGASVPELNTLVAAAVDGEFERVLVDSIAGVSLRQAVLTHDIKRQTHLELTMPFARVEMDHLNTSLATTEAIDSDRGRILIYDLHAEDLTTAKGKFSSRFAVNGRFVQQGATRIFDEQSMTHSYTFRQAARMMRRSVLEAQLSAYTDLYSPNTFGTGEASFRTWISDLDRTVDKTLNNGPDNFGNTLLTLEVSAPSTLVGAWALAPDSATAVQYFAMSKRIQAQLRKLIPLTYFSNPAKYADRIPSAALLVYAALPPAAGITVEGGRIARFDATSDVYPDIDTSGHLEALARHSLTVAALATRLVTVHDVLRHTEGMAGVAKDYDPSRTDRILNDGLTTPNGLADLQALLAVERRVIRGAHAAGVAIGGFLKSRSSAEARRRLAEYGTQVTDAFNSRIGGLFSGKELRPFGTLVFLEAARAFDASLESTPSSAILELTVLKDHPSFEMGTFVDGAEIPAGDIVDAQKFVALA